ncbi:suppressor of cytokine signaling 3-like [Lethenteron reissneri]|uniref:suppressor of cytokine signaling 3-like n=1 Tax=Lethenteron reissneri TaxID=7753 RepID=UPI002AB7E8B4|nr:suppressor of cytokine signaling 3-like [Lethenteron reissneri]
MRTTDFFNVPLSSAANPGPVNTSTLGPAKVPRRNALALDAASDEPPPASQRTHFLTFASEAAFLTVRRSWLSLLESGFYWGPLSQARAAAELGGQEDGTFLVRNSADSRHLYTLSVQTPLGAANVRIKFDGGAFYLETERELEVSAPKFECIISLLQYYMRRTAAEEEEEEEEEERRTRSGGCGGAASPRRSRGVPLRLRRPLGRSRRPPRLDHCCRRTLSACCAQSGSNSALEGLPLPSKLKEFLAVYPFQL